MTKHIDKAWRNFAETVIPIDAGDNQRRVMRQTFYAGALSLWGLFMGDLFEPGDEPTAKDEAVCSEIDAELKAFWNAIAEGKQP